MMLSEYIDSSRVCSAGSSRAGIRVEQTERHLTCSLFEQFHHSSSFTILPFPGTQGTVARESRNRVWYTFTFGLRAGVRVAVKTATQQLYIVVNENPLTMSPLVDACTVLDQYKGLTYSAAAKAYPLTVYHH